MQATESWVGLGNKASFILYAWLAFPLIVSMSMYNLGKNLTLHIWTCMSHVIVNLYKCSKCIVPFCTCMHSRSRPKQQQSTSISLVYRPCPPPVLLQVIRTVGNGTVLHTEFHGIHRQVSPHCGLRVSLVSVQSPQKFEHNWNLLYSCKSRKVKAKSYLSICQFLLGQICLLKWKVVAICMCH